MQINAQTVIGQLGQPISPVLAQIMKRKEEAYHKEKRRLMAKQEKQKKLNIDSFRPDSYGLLPIDTGTRPIIKGESVLHWVWDVEYTHLIWVASHKLLKNKFKACVRLIDIDNGNVLKRRPLWYTGSSRGRFREIVGRQMDDRFGDIVEVEDTSYGYDFYLGVPWDSVVISIEDVDKSVHRS